MRLFCAIDLPSKVKANLDGLLRRLRPAAPFLQWSPIENLHVTTKFIGEWSEDRLPELENALAAIPAPPPFHMEVRGLGWFPNPHSPRVFWAGVQAAPGLRELARSTEDALAALGIAKEDRLYAPHLTLARLKKPQPLTDLLQRIAALDSVEFGQFQPRQFHLYQSETGPGGSIYTKVADFPLGTSQ